MLKRREKWLIILYFIGAFNVCFGSYSDEKSYCEKLLLDINQYVDAFEEGAIPFDGAANVINSFDAIDKRLFDKTIVIKQQFDDCSDDAVIYLSEESKNTFKNLHTLLTRLYNLCKACRLKKVTNPARRINRFRKYVISFFNEIEKLENQLDEGNIGIIETTTSEYGESESGDTFMLSMEKLKDALSELDYAEEDVFLLVRYCLKDLLLRYIGGCGQYCRPKICSQARFNTGFRKLRRMVCCCDWRCCSRQDLPHEKSKACTAKSRELSYCLKCMSLGLFWFGTYLQASNTVNPQSSRSIWGWVVTSTATTLGALDACCCHNIESFNMQYYQDQLEGFEAAVELLNSAPNGSDATEGRSSSSTTSSVRSSRPRRFIGDIRMDAEWW